MGWGYTDANGENNVDVLNFANVTDFAPVGWTIWIEGQAGETSAPGDSGGPLVCNGRLFGIISTGFGLHLKFPISVFNAIVHQLDWIQSFMN